MKPFRSSVLLALAGLLAVSCSRQDDTTDSAANPLLAHVPADTPYVFANLESTPAAIVDAWLVRLEPALAHAQSRLDAFQAELEAGPADVDDGFASVAAAVLAELDGKLNRAGLESLGISLEALNAVYGNGLFPVARLGLKDAQALRDAVERIEKGSGTAIPKYRHGDRSYWRIADEGNGIAAFIAILDDHVALGAAPIAAEEAFIPELLGARLPESSLADAGTLARLNRDKGFRPWGSGYVDLARVVDELFQPDSHTATWLTVLGEYRPEGIDPACAREARRVTDFVPRIVAGVTEMTADTVSMRYQFEFERSLAGELAALVADVPPAPSDPGYMLALSLGIEVGALREFLLEKANDLAAQPFQCPRLEDLNDQIRQAATRLNQPMPPFVGNLRGFRAVLEEFDPADVDPENVRGLFALEVASPQMLIGMANMMVPGFEELAIEPGNDPVQVPAELMSVVTPGLEVYAMMTGDAIGLSVGKGLKDRLLGFMEAKQDNRGAFLSLEYDLAGMMETGRHGIQSWDGTGATHGELAAIYRDMLARTRLELRFTDAGLVIDNRVTFK